MRVHELSRIVQTVSRLKFRQVAYQVIRRLGCKTRIHNVPRLVTLQKELELIPPVARTYNGDNSSFTFLDVKCSFDPSNFDWSCSEMSKLWRYNLHYFDYLNEDWRSWENKAFLISDWISKNPQGKEDAWEPFPVSLRIVNWIKTFLSPEAREKVEDAWLRSLYEQTLWLEKNIEHHLLANHLFKNGKALFFAGLYFSGTDAERWLKKGLKIISAEIDEQILADGGHFERSPMYHAMICEDCLDMLSLAQGSGGRVPEHLAERLREKCTGMVRFIRGMSHPDGNIALFNDAAFGIEAGPAGLIAYFERITGEKVHETTESHWAFPETGYYVMAPRAGDRLIIDCGPVGPDYQPGHSHCDLLSFELSLKGRRVIVDSGCCQYTDGDIRRYNRGNAGHNTITIDGRNQSEVWGAHRCAHRAYPLYARSANLADGSLAFSGAHNGYMHMKGCPVHHRAFSWCGDTLQVEDRIDGQGAHGVEARLHIHPDLEVELIEGRSIIRSQGEMLAVISPHGDGRLETEDGWYCPEFGIQRSCAVLVVKHNSVPLPYSGGWVISTGV